MNVTTPQLILMGVGSLALCWACAYVLYQIGEFLIQIYRGAMEAARAGKTSMSPRWTRITVLGTWSVVAALVVVPFYYGVTLLLWPIFQASLARWSSLL